MEKGYSVVIFQHELKPGAVSTEVMIRPPGWYSAAEGTNTSADIYVPRIHQPEQSLADTALTIGTVVLLGGAVLAGLAGNNNSRFLKWLHERFEAHPDNDAD